MSAQDDLRRAIEELLRAGRSVDEIAADVAGAIGQVGTETAGAVAEDFEAMGKALLGFRLPQLPEVPELPHRIPRGGHVEPPGHKYPGWRKIEKAAGPQAPKLPPGVKHAGKHIAGSEGLVFEPHARRLIASADLQVVWDYVKPIPDYKWEIIRITETKKRRHRRLPAKPVEERTAAWNKLTLAYRRRLIAAGKRYGMDEKDVVAAWTTGGTELARLRGHPPKASRRWYEGWVLSRS